MSIMRNEIREHREFTPSSDEAARFREAVQGVAPNSDLGRMLGWLTEGWAGGGRTTVHIVDMLRAAFLDDQTQAPAIECGIILCTGHAIEGSLSITPAGCLRMLNHDGTMREMLFAADSVIAVSQRVRIDVKLGS